MNTPFKPFMHVGLVAMIALIAGCASNTQSETTTSAYPLGCTSDVGYSLETGMPCSTETVTTTTTTTRDDQLMPVPDGAEGYSYGEPMSADEVTDWFTPIPDTMFNVNSAGKPFWVCTESIPDSGIASWCSHYYEFSLNAFEGWRWQGVASGDQRIQLRADWDDTVLYMTNVPFQQEYCMDCKG